MKKQLLVGAFMLASFFTANAQSLVSNDFGTDEASYQAAMEGWGSYAFDTDGDFFTASLEDLQLGFTGVYMTSGTVKNTGTNEAPVLVDLVPVNFLASPAVDLTSIATANISLKVGAFGAEGAVMGYQILIITEADWAAETFDNMLIAGEGTVTAGDSETVSFPLNNVAANVRFLILHDGETSNGRGYLLVDDIAAKQGAAGVNENLMTSLSVYPNPANDVVNVTNAENILVNGITVTDLNGRTVKSSKFDGVANAQINISDLASGVYMMTVSSDKGSMTKKIVKN